MAGSPLSAALIHAASYYPPAPPENAAWDVLYWAAGMIGLVLLVALAATLANAREDHRHDSGPR